ncbi:hypothetical protein [Chitinibacter sp. ZOR0017]|uniref:hypothetical protein n=1 Tax=Chitinibacter sp. ZOR0017 TaxID=1339254 RepID=UPI000647D93D|nr:hypothetical protein [Chitinibacter sp. ZOR0017]
MNNQEIILNAAKGTQESGLLLAIVFFLGVFIFVQIAFWGAVYLHLFLSVLLLLGIVLLSWLAATDTELVFNPQDRSIYSRSLFFGRRSTETKVCHVSDYDYLYIPVFDAKADRSRRYFLTLFSAKLGEQALYRVEKEKAEKEISRISEIFGLPNKGFLDRVGFRNYAGSRKKDSFT